MMRINLFLMCLPVLLCACAPQPGDSCEYSDDCPLGMICDVSSPGGYCLNYNCEFDRDCPDDTTCVAFDKQLSFCLKTCKSNKDCRKDYACRDDVGTKPFCYVPTEKVYGRDKNNKINL